MTSLEQMVKKYIITTAQYNAGVNKQLLINMEKYSNDNNAEILILPAVGKNVTEEQILSPDLAQYRQITTEWKINNSLKIKDFGARMQQINPLTGLERFAQGDKSYIMPGTKQVLKYIANSYDDIPKAIMTTGAITKPNYNLRHRTGRIAKADHEYGFVVVEVQNNKYFHFRHIRSLKNGNFSDVSGLYKNGKHYKDPKPKAIIVGDLHPGDTNPMHEKNTFDQITYFGGKIDLYLHDTFNGKSISHWNEGHSIKKYQVWEEQGLNLEKELKDTLKAINRYAAATTGTVYIVASNHDEHLYRYLDEGRFVFDKGNTLIGAKLFVESCQGYNPLKSGLQLVGDIAKNVEFIDRDTGHKVLGYELGKHGDEGANGGRGSPRSIENANSKSITGHGHSAFKIRNTYRIGTSTYMRIGYNTGYSNWSNTNGILYQDGTVQLLNTINNKWRI